ncbi:MAG: uroporphyrinogen-III synthase [Devosia sp.]
MLSMLVTRPEPDASDTAARLRALDIDPVIAPLLQFELLNTTLPPAEGFAAIAATSANALRALHERGEIPHFAHLPLYAVGDRTAAAARELGFAEVVSASGDLPALVDLLAHADIAGPIFYPAARNPSGDLGKALAPHGIMVIAAPVYRMAPLTARLAEVLDRLDAGQISAALFYSRRTAETFVSIADSRLGRSAHLGLGMLCLSDAVAAPLIDAHFVRISLADHPNEAAMLSLALSFAREQNPA